MRFAQSILLIFFFLISLSAIAQERCGTVKYNQQLKDKKQIPQNDDVFENWLQQKISIQRTFRNQRKQSGSYQVPVVVHVVHNGEPIGTGTNISDAQIISQINVLNKDYNRLNADASSTPLTFTSVAGSMDIEFVLAKQDPEGLPTTGIVRVRGSKSGWTSNDNYELKNQSYWPSEDYLNLWVCDLIDDLVGYAQLPESNLNGLENSSNNAFTDGVVIWYKAFGSVDDGPFILDSNFDRGRTVTHEVGHFFGLRHIWGDDNGSCSGTDYVDDTPNQASSNTGCPNHPKKSCPDIISMFQNFLDYTDDRCMNLFTKGQVSRMETVIENSPRRKSLLTSHGLNTPGTFLNDLGIKEIVSPLTTTCDANITPTLEVKNYGSNTITSCRIRMLVDGSIVETKDFSMNLDPAPVFESTQVTFSMISVSTGEHDIAFEILQTNGVADGYALNNQIAQNFLVPETIAIPFAENFNSLPSGWTIENPDQLTTWEIVTAPKEAGTNKALRMNFSEYEESYGEFDIFLSPVFDLSTVSVASLNFDIAHARYSSSNDRLKVVLLKNCESLSEGVTIYDKAGGALATTSPTAGFYIPSGEDEWRKEFVNISQFIGESHVQLAFIGVSDWGNNLYLDNIKLLSSELEDLILSELTTPGIVTCDLQPTPHITIQNAGTIAIANFVVEVSVNNGVTQLAQVTEQSIGTAEELEVILPNIDLHEGVNKIVINITEPNGKPDQTPENNTQEFTVVVNTAVDRIPLRENFDSSFENEWTTVSPSGGTNWESTTTNFNTSLFYQAYNNETLGEEAWLVSPILDFSGSEKASVVFDLSYRMRLEKKEDLKIMASIDCGNSFQEVATISLPSGSNEGAWTPQNETDWQQKNVISLNEYAGEEEVRIVFVATNKNGNNLFLDNIEFFITDTPDFVTVKDQYSIYGYNLEVPSQSALKISFNLTQRQDVPYTIVDAMGKSHAFGTLLDVLNQTYPLEVTENLSPGMYIVRVKISGKYYADRIIVAK